MLGKNQITTPNSPYYNLQQPNRDLKLVKTTRGQLKSDLAMMSASNGTGELKQGTSTSSQLLQTARKNNKYYHHQGHTASIPGSCQNAFDAHLKVLDFTTGPLTSIHHCQSQPSLQREPSETFSSKLISVLRANWKNKDKD